MTPDQFIDKWKGATLKERSASQAWLGALDQRYPVSFRNRNSPYSWKSNNSAHFRAAGAMIFRLP